MKKAISVLLVLLVLIVCSIGNALAEDFIIRNGIRFGMTVDEVKNIELTNGVSNEDIQFSDFLGEQLYIRTNIAGYDNAHVAYIVNDINNFRLQSV